MFPLLGERVRVWAKTTFRPIFRISPLQPEADSADNIHVALCGEVLQGKSCCKETNRNGLRGTVYCR